MKRSRFAKEQIIGVLKNHQAGTSAAAHPAAARRPAAEPQEAVPTKPSALIRKPTALRFATGSPMFLQQLLHRRHVQHLIGDDPLEFGVLSLQLPEPLRI